MGGEVKPPHLYTPIPMFYFYILVFIVSCFLLFCSGKWLVDGLIKIARFLKWRDFVVAFFIVAFAGSAPNFFLGLLSALQKIPQLSFGDTIGGNIIDLTLVIALAVLFSNKGLPVKSKMVQTSAIFTAAIAVLPLFLILDGILSRSDGIILISVFILYVFWLFSKKERFSKEYNGTKDPVEGFKDFINGLLKTGVGIVLLGFASLGMVKAGSFFAQEFNLPLVLIGMLVIALGNAFPETYFTIISARKNRNWMVLGDLMGVVIVAATLVLGMVALICPIEISNISPYAIARFFLVIAAFFFLFFIRTDRKITKKEAIFLMGIYFLFVLAEILIR